MPKNTNKPSLSNSKEKIKILVIDDEEGIRNMLAYELKSKGYEVVTAPDGQEGVEVIRNNDKINIVISDVKMPKLNGLDALGIIKSINPRIEVIMTTGYGSIDMAVECMKKGAYDFISKPYNMDELHSRMEKAIEKQRLSSEVLSLKELNRLKSEFLANTSHELRTPMNAIIGYTFLMLDRVYGDLTEKQERALKRMSTNANSLLQLINNILDISRLSAGKIQLFLEEFSVNELVEEIVEMMDALAKEKSISLSCKIDETIKLNSDITRLKQIIINLVGNSIKFTDKGGVTISAHLLEDPGSTDSVDRIQIDVIDTGIGIRNEDQGKIFEEFQQIDASTTRKYVGAGLGLAIVKKFTGLLGGNISVKSKVGQGSTFSLVFPCNIKPSEAVDESASFGIQGYSDTQKNEKTLLIIDDDPEVHKLIKDSLQDKEYAFVSALNADEGIAFARQYHPFAIILDILMPHRDGWSVLLSLKSESDTKSIPVIIVSIMENKALAYSLGVSEYMVKPLKKDTLLEKLDQLEHGFRVKAEN